MTPRVATPDRPTWPEAEILAEPRKPKDLDEPVVLVRRRAPLILGPNGEELIRLPGPSHISLFTGAGGMDIGVEQAGFCTLVQHEWDAAACGTLMVNRPGFFRRSALIQGDLRRTPTSMLLREAGLRVGEAHLLTGGPPCQGFSTSGRRQESDPRNTLVFEYLRVVREARPRFFVMENVPGFTDLAKGRFLREFLAEAYGCYYELVYGIANAVEYGVPQDRNRFLCMGTRRDLVECDGVIASLPSPERFGRRDLARIREIEGQSLFRHAIVADAEELELLTHPPGIRYFPDRPVLVPPRPTQGSCDGRTRTFLEFYKRLRREEPDRLVTAPLGGAA